jgi:hypothetical protein
VIVSRTLHIVEAYLRVVTLLPSNMCISEHVKPVPPRALKHKRKLPQTTQLCRSEVPRVKAEELALFVGGHTEGMRKRYFGLRYLCHQLQADKYYCDMYQSLVLCTARVSEEQACSAVASQPQTHCLPVFGNPSLESRLERGDPRSLYGEDGFSTSLSSCSRRNFIFARLCGSKLDHPRADDAGLVAVITALRFTPGKRIEDESWDGGVETCLSVRM